MSTILQQNLAREIVSDFKTGRKRNKKELLVSGGYSEIVAAAKPQEIIQQKGVQEALEDLGFTTEGADNVVKNILYRGKKEENRLKAADMIYKRVGAYKDTEQGAGKTLILAITGETAQRYDLDRSSEENSTGQA